VAEAKRKRAQLTSSASSTTVSNPPAEGAKTDEKVRKEIVTAIKKKSTDPEFAENLAYDVSEEFGDKFKTWLGEDKNRNIGAEAKAREWYKMWRAHIGVDATINTFIELMEDRDKDCALQLRKSFALL